MKISIIFFKPNLYGICGFDGGNETYFRCHKQAAVCDFAAEKYHFSDQYQTQENWFEVESLLLFGF